MQARITGVLSQKSRFHNGLFYYILFKGEDDRNYKTCADTKCRNFKKWKPYCTLEAKGITLGGLTVMKRGLIDADSDPVVVSMPAAQPKAEEAPTKEQFNLF